MGKRALVRVEAQPTFGGTGRRGKTVSGGVFCKILEEEKTKSGSMSVGAPCL